MPTKRIGDYTVSELKVLWLLKRHGGSLQRRESRGVRDTLYKQMGRETGLNSNTIASMCAKLEQRSIVLRTFDRPQPAKFSTIGYNPVLKVELVDPRMELPPLPPAPPTQVVIARENVEMQQVVDSRRRQAVETGELDPMAVMLALIEENEAKLATIKQREVEINDLKTTLNERDSQNEKLKDIVEAQAKELMNRPKTPRMSGLTQRVQDVLPKEVWDRLQGGGGQ